MDRLTTGRRHVRAGSVHVTELINKDRRRIDPGAEHTLPGPRTPAPPPERADEPSPGSHRRSPSRGVQVAKLTSLGVAALVLCGAVAAASIISHQRADQAPAQRPVVRITGDQALLPDRLDRSIPTEAAARPAPPPATRQAATGTPVAGNPVPPAPGVAAPATAPHPAATRAAPAAAPSPAQPPAVLPMSDVALVETFYELLPSAPDVAFGLISPSLLDATLGEFLDSWSTVRQIDVLAVHQHPDGVVAVVRMALAGGGELRVEQLLTVAEAPRRITGAQLLSAQRS